MSVTVETELGGRQLTIETGKLALLAGGAVTVRFGDTVILGTANRSEPRPGLDFFPLTVDFEERMYAAGKIPGGFIKRESRPSEAAILAARLTDRPIRPLFPAGYKDDVQVVLTVLSTDQENDPDVIGTIAGSAALTISEIPFEGPIAAVRVGRINGELVVNPRISEMDSSEIDLVVAGTRDAIMMVEAGAKIVPEDVMAEAIMFGHRAIQPIIELQEQLRAQVGKPKRVPFLEPSVESVTDFVERVAAGQEFVVVDVETTGRDVKTAEILEIAAVRVRGQEIVDRWSTLVNPGRPIFGAQIHGISDADVQGQPSAREAAQRFLEFAGASTIVAHNVGFDLGFIEAALSDTATGEAFRFAQDRYLDTWVLARETYPDQADSFKLPDLARFLGVEVESSHRALPDAEATARVLLRLASDLPGRVERIREAIENAIRMAREDKQASERMLEQARLDGRVSKGLFGHLHKTAVRRLILDEGLRMDGRGLDEIRPISVEVGLLPRAHGSGLFTRGQTQALTVATLGASSDVQRIDTISPEESKRFLHHYNFPPYSVGENRMMRGPSRRDIGHGALAERALIPVLPSQEEFPYVIRLVSEVVTSNGSTSMASTCGSTLALMDAGVPIKAPVAGAAMGLVIGADGRYAVLTDIIGKEDAFGDMDFKVTGTGEGVTALQMDIKVRGIGEAIIRDGLARARTARLFILGKMLEVLPTARTEMSEFAPRIITIKINPEKIREIIGKGGSMIRKIQEETGTEINVEDDGSVEIAAVSGENSRKAIQWIESLTRDVEIGALYLGKVTRIMGFGAFVEILPGKEGLVRIGELADYHVPTVEDVVSVGDEIMVVVTEIDRQGRVNLSRKAAMQRHLAKEPVAG
ncbi:MAG TPA: polyribonucleotide nucleotidyltransferase [Candidatus Limnocylindrales bacterium]|nr:polyribonucleotide nucleotidyltransferase [Candidatus Limnocylindrales bacterium]